MKLLPSQEYLKSRIEYNPETGIARWKLVDESFGLCWKIFNTRFAGKILAKVVTINYKRYSLLHLIYKLYYNKDVTRVSYVNTDSTDLRIQNLISSCDLDVKVQLSTIENKEAITNTKLIDPLVKTKVKYNAVSGDITWFNGLPAGGLDVEGYKRVQINRKKYRQHRLAWYLYYGIDPVGYFIDHVDGDKANNKITNLRLAVNSLNMQAAQKNKKGYRYVNSRYVVHININTALIRLGTFDTAEEATAAYESALAKYKPTYVFTESEQKVLDELYNSYPNCSKQLQKQCHDLQVVALDHYIDAANVQGVKYNCNSLP